MCNDISLREILENAGLWTIAGVTLGFLLGEVSRVIRERRRRNQLIKALTDEVRSLTWFIPDKQRILQNMITSIDQKLILSGHSIHAPTVIFDSHFATIYEHLTLLQKHNIHIIYSRIKSADEWMDNYEHEIKKDIDMKIMKEPWELYKARLQDLHKNYTVLLNIIDQYLKGTPVDVLHTNFKE